MLAVGASREKPAGLPSGEKVKVLHLLRKKEILYVTVARLYVSRNLLPVKLHISPI